MSIYLTGASGFIGKNLVSYFGNKVQIKKHVRGSEFLIKQKVVIHLAGKAHDLKNISKIEEYYKVNTDLTREIFDSFLKSDSIVFITLSSVKAVSDNVVGVLNEEYEPDPKTHYGKSKLLAENYILSKRVCKLRYPDDYNIQIPVPQRPDLHPEPLSHRARETFHAIRFFYGVFPFSLQGTENL